MDDFDDADLDDLPPGTYQDLEQRAFSSSQYPSQRPPNRNAVLANGSSKALGGTRKEAEVTGVPHSSEYEFDDEDVIDLDAHPQPLPFGRSGRLNAKADDEVTQRERWRQQRYSAPWQPNGSESRRGHASFGYSRHDSRNHVNGVRGGTNAPNSEAKSFAQQHRDSSPADEPDLATLKQHILELEQDQSRLRHEAEDARASVVSKLGEISIVRANHGKTTKEFELRLVELQQSHANELAKQRAELDAVRKERQRIETNNRFLENDLAQEAERGRVARRSLRDTTGNPAKGVASGSPLSTPKKMGKLPFRDGFDDDEVMAVSPSSMEKLKMTTPRAGSKRKRPEPQKSSPGQPLDLVGPVASPLASQADDGFRPVSLDQADSATAVVNKSLDEKYQFVQLVLDCESERQRKRIVEVLTAYALPSEEERSFSSLLLDHLSPDASNESNDDFRKGFCEFLTMLWTQCLDQSYHAPLYDLKELLQYLLMYSPTHISSALIPLLVPLCQSTADLVALPVARAAMTVSPTALRSKDLETHVDPAEYLELLQLIVTDCQDEPGSLRDFWSCVHFEFILLVLHRAQPDRQIILALQLLTTSVLRDSFGTISQQPTTSANFDAISKQAQNESSLINRLTLLLYDSSATSNTSSGQPQSAAEIPESDHVLELRQEVLNLLRTLCQTTHGGRSLATHRLAVGRLVRFLHDSITLLYDYDPHTHSKTTQLVNDTVMLLSHLTQRYRDVVDLRTRLAAVSGASHKHLVALSRVAFAEGISVIEEGIKREVIEMAHKMLDEHLSPEEGEAVVEVFSSGRQA
ncbi:MAG: hypothetical protein M1828_001077 [Chrysothrix sp. TS-e1954]|nr:MAG: hypothetical protein M1828_001077 [Chrysothrix sp. TS-e1954]